MLHRQFSLLGPMPVTHQEIRHLLVDYPNGIEIVGAIGTITSEFIFAHDERSSPAALCPGVRPIAFFYRLILRLELDQEFTLLYQQSPNEGIR